MAEANARLYEGMFLVNPAAVGASVGSATQVVNDLLARSDAEVVAIYRWDDRRLAYPIEKQKRGMYVLAYFNVDGSKIARIENDVNFSEQILRCLILRADYMGEAELETAKQKHQETADAAAVESAGESAEGEGQEQPTEPSASSEGDAAGAAEQQETVESSRSE